MDQMTPRIQEARRSRAWERIGVGILGPEAQAELGRTTPYCDLDPAGFGPRDEAPHHHVERAHRH